MKENHIITITMTKKAIMKKESKKPTCPNHESHKDNFHLAFDPHDDTSNIPNFKKNLVPEPREVEHPSVHKGEETAGCAVVTTNYCVNDIRNKKEACPGRSDPTDEEEALLVPSKVAE